MNTFPEAIYHVNDILTQYVSIHDELFAFSWRKLIPIPGIFKPIDYPRYRDELGVLVSRLMDALDSSTDDRLPSAFSSYGEALRRTIEALQCICSRLSDKAKGSRYPMAKYDIDMASYKALCNKYLRLGAILNQQLNVAP